ncbi:MAG: hypothetical protein ACLURV_06425 [Gallintestinimicrobium sp.]
MGQIGVYTGWLEEIAAGSRSQITAFDWIGMIFDLLRASGGAEPGVWTDLRKSADQRR